MTTATAPGAARALPTPPRRRFDAPTRARMRRFLRGEMTWAEVEGMTYEQAERIAGLACELAAQGRLHEARVLFEGLVAGNPEDTSAQAALGTVYERLGLADEALGCYERALGLFAGNVVALAHRGELRLRRGDRAGLEDLAEAARLDPAGTIAAGRRARGLLKLLQARLEASRGARRRAG